MTAQAKIGSVSHGTMRPEDLVPTFLYELGQLDKPAHDKFVAANAEWLDNDELNEDDAEYADALDDISSELFDLLNDYAPPYCYFGANKGDGADYGFWVSWESFESDVTDGVIVKVPAGDEWDREKLKECVEYVAEVTDHGNVTLLTAAGKEVWAVV